MDKPFSRKQTITYLPFIAQNSQMKGLRIEDYKIDLGWW
jgi:hypothetical protein